MRTTARTVVGAAILRDGRVLAARRADPPGWELPGGKVEPGESDEGALVREIAEELGVRVVVTGWLAGEIPIRDGLVLRAALAHTDDEPAAVEHAELRWLGPDELDDVDWLAADRPFLPELREILLR